MSRASDEALDDDAELARASAREGDPGGSETQPLRTLSNDASSEDVEDFMITYGLAEQRLLFQKAARVLHNNVDDQQVDGLAPQEAAALRRETTHKWHQPWTLYLTIFVCSLGAIEQGWAQTGMNGANLYLPAAFGLDSNSTYDSFVLGLINCGLYLAQGLIGCWLSEPLNNRMGRRGTIFVGASLCLIGNLGASISWSWPVLVLFRLVLGTGLGVDSSIVSVFAAESAPAYIRGGLGVSWQMFTAFGVFLGFLANATVAIHFEGRDNLVWRILLAAPLVPAVQLLLMVYSCPESPAWHISRGGYDKALESLNKLRNTKLQAACELYSNYLSRRRHKSPKDNLSYFAKYRYLFTLPRNRHALMASYTVMLSQQLCGINIIAFYSSTIFSNSGFSAKAALWASVIFGFVNFLGAFPSIWAMDTFGRRKLLTWTLPPMAATMALAGASFSLPSGTSQFVILAGLIYLFCALYSPGMGPVPCAYSAEVYPLSVREVGMSFAISTAASWATVLSLTFPVLLERLGEQGSFELYAVLNLLAWALCWLFVRETKNVELEEMDEVFASSPMRFVREQWSEVSGRWSQRSGYGKVGHDDFDDL